jgi:hypothetical protein
VEEILEELCRAAIWITIEVLLKGPGYFIVRHVWRTEGDIDVDGLSVAASGLMFWGLLGCAVGAPIFLLM